MSKPRLLSGQVAFGDTAIKQAPSSCRLITSLPVLPRLGAPQSGAQRRSQDATTSVWCAAEVFTTRAVDPGKAQGGLQKRVLPVSTAT